MNFKSLCLLVFLIFNFSRIVLADSLEERFAQPPQDFGPRCYWYWQNGNISKEGITKDLEAMKRVGIVQPYIGVINGGAVKALSDEWWGMMVHAIREASRLGMHIGVFNCPGWSQSGGPWVQASQSMRYMVPLEIRVKGPQFFSGKIEPEMKDCQEIAVIAFPVGSQDGEKINDRLSGAKRDKANEVLFEFKKPVSIQTLVITPTAPLKRSGEIQYSNDGQKFTTIRTFDVRRGNPGANIGPVALAPVTVSFSPVRARWIRIVFDQPSLELNVDLLAAPRIDAVEEKQLLKIYEEPQPPFNWYSWKTQNEPSKNGNAISSSRVLDISKNMRPDGTVEWQVPEGEWIIQRLVAKPTGVKNGPAAAEASGYEIDKMSREHLRSHFKAYVGKLLSLLNSEEKKAWTHVIADSYETGPQNWTDDLISDFQNRYHYSPLPFLPVLSGRVIESADRSDRFLWDLRRMVADRVATDYVGGLRELCHQNGMKMWLENYGHWGFPGEFLNYGGQTDELGGEFWTSGILGDVELRDASSCAHIYGKKSVFAEAFTSGGPLFRNTPWDLKQRGDWAYCQGINHFVLHVYIHQPWSDRLPGVNAEYGTEINRNNTWFEFSKGWIDYLRRCHVLLQQGKPVADVLYFIGEETPQMTGPKVSSLPAGYDFDYINAEVLLNRLTVKEGKLFLPEGNSYRLLVLPEQRTMRPVVLKKIKELVDSGATVIGYAPERSPSNENYSQADQEIRSISKIVWGQGKIRETESVGDALRRIGVAPDIQGIESKKVLYTHRRDEKREIYFLSNQTEETLSMTPTFRAFGTPSFWDADRGTTEKGAIFEVGKNGTQVPLTLKPRESLFVVFEENRNAPSIVEIKKDGVSVVSLKEKGITPKNNTLISIIQDSKGNYVARPTVSGEFQITFQDQRKATLAVPSIPSAIPFSQPWKVTFDPQKGGPRETQQWDQLQDWSLSTIPEIRYYSGTARYQTTIQVAELTSRMILDLGEVLGLAKVKVNHQEVAILWKKPFEINVSPWIQKGGNLIEIEVANTWYNRLLGDHLSKDEKKWTSVTVPMKFENESLQPSGLCGPVLLRPEIEQVLRAQ